VRQFTPGVTSGPSASSVGRYPSGTGWIAGFALGVVAGVAAWVASGRVVLGLILLVATGTAMGAAFERSLATRPLTPAERRLALAALAAGVALGLLVLASAALFT